MKIGILETEQLKPEIVKQYGSYGDMTIRLLRAVDEDVSFQTYQVISGEYPNDSNDCDAFLITGSKASAYDNEPWIKQLESYITTLAEQQQKLIGICFGHQLIAQALGGKVEKSNKGWGVGVMASDVLQNKSWMQPAQEQYSLLVSHQDQVVELPDGAERIAGSDFCINSSYQVSNHILGFQGHPEFTVEYAQQSMDKRRKIIGEERYQQAQGSLDKTIDHRTVARWILNFVGHHHN